VQQTEIIGLFCRVKSLFHRSLLQKRPIILRSLLIEATERERETGRKRKIKRARDTNGKKEKDRGRQGERERETGRATKRE